MRMNVSKGNELVLDSKHDCTPAGGDGAPVQEGGGQLRGRDRG